mmetsp:Transcript_9333/g.20242  ORF Transcript_9333/g.20242 Transcript_9333/m.20242 type:complete len:122 (-) Transcript_9333:3046-3411(-)
MLNYYMAAEEVADKNTDHHDIEEVDQKEEGVSHMEAAGQKAEVASHMEEAGQKAEEAGRTRWLVHSLLEEGVDSMSKLAVALLAEQADVSFPNEKLLQLIQREVLEAEVWVYLWELLEDFS